MQKQFSVFVVIVLFVLGFLPAPETMAGEVDRGSGRVYSTKFRLAENPISEGGNWMNGKTVGLDWSDASTTPGLAIGRQSGFDGFDDAVALLTGSWGPDQKVRARVHTVSQNDDILAEVEIRLRSTLTPHSCTGYEVLFSARSSAKAYIGIVRWNGPLGDFTGLAGRTGPEVGIRDGDVVKATIVGNVITAYINNVQVLQVTDSTYANGSPGMGFYLQGGSGVNGDYGFTKFKASSR